MTTRDRLDHLLARGRLSAPRRERIFEEVDKAVRPRTRSRYLLLAGPLAVAAALAVFLRPLAPTSGFSAKGSGASMMEVGCTGGDLSACPRGSKLIFRFGANSTPLFLQAYAEPLRPDRERVWYFPTQSTPAPVLEPGAEVRSLEKGVVLGSEHPPGPYRIHVVLSDSRLSRDDVLRSVGSGNLRVETFDLEVTDP